MENLVLRDQKVRLKVDTNLASKKRTCSCTVGQYDDKTNKLVPPQELAGYREKYITVMMQPNLIEKEVIDSHLGKSKGAQNKYDIMKMNEQLNNLIDDRIEMWPAESIQTELDSQASQQEVPSAPTVFAKSIREKKQRDRTERMIIQK